MFEGNVEMFDRGCNDLQRLKVRGGDGVISSVIAEFASGFRIRGSLNCYHVLAYCPTNIRQDSIRLTDVQLLQW
jgi:hypothetical protein